ncbi:hypothetical protein M0812_22264 [Anaeramoeba flamelloides]|uniref:Uncharacterized protein n=1 Tax=Anaeramoeba flamelloides TaxID=1746091 RepID=A0AAV7YX44_9EUKA|nr:hypothetical protein M0812_22264 [Anaeramoeba flamelloides]
MISPYPEFCFLPSNYSPTDNSFFSFIGLGKTGVLFTINQNQLKNQKTMQIPTLFFFKTPALDQKMQLEVIPLFAPPFVCVFQSASLSHDENLLLLNVKHSGSIKGAMSGEYQSPIVKPKKRRKNIVKTTHSTILVDIQEGTTLSTIFENTAKTEIHFLESCSKNWSSHSHMFLTIFEKGEIAVHTLQAKKAWLSKKKSFELKPKTETLHSEHLYSQFDPIRMVLYVLKKTQYPAQLRIFLRTFSKKKPLQKDYRISFGHVVNPLSLQFLLYSPLAHKNKKPESDKKNDGFVFIKKISINTNINTNTSTNPNTSRVEKTKFFNQNIEKNPKIAKVLVGGSIPKKQNTPRTNSDHTNTLISFPTKNTKKYSQSYEFLDNYNPEISNKIHPKLLLETESKNEKTRTPPTIFKI